MVTSLNKNVSTFTDTPDLINNCETCLELIKNDNVYYIDLKCSKFYPLFPIFSHFFPHFIYFLSKISGTDIKSEIKTQINELIDQVQVQENEKLENPTEKIE